MTNELVREDMLLLMSDFYKEARGVRPRGYNFDAYTDSELQKFWKELSKEIDVNEKEEKLAEIENLAAFKTLVQKTIDTGVNTGTMEERRATALRWLWDAEGMGEAWSVQDIEHFVWKKGLLFTDYGKELIKELKPIVPMVSEENPGLFKLKF